MVERLDNHKRFLWIKAQTKNIDWDKWNGVLVKNFIPPRYESYCKIMHPIYRDSSIKDEALLYSQCDPDDDEWHIGKRITFKELADKYNLQYTKEFSSRTLEKVLGGYPRYIILGGEGSIDDEQTLHQLISVLEKFTGRNRCYFYYDLLKVTNYSPEAIEPLFVGNMEEVLELYDNSVYGLVGTPSYWWPEDKSWSLFTEIDLDFTIIGGSKTLIDSLLNNEELECIEVDANTRVDWEADVVNIPHKKAVTKMEKMIDLSKKPTLQGEKVLLRPFYVEKDFPYLEECLKDPVVLKYTGSSDDFDKDKVYQWYSTRNNQIDRLDLAIVDKSEKTLVGEAVVNSYDEKMNSMNFRILIGPRGRDKGLGTEATRLIVDYVFQETTLDELTLSVYAFNPRAKKVYEKIGFVMDSIDKNDLEYEGEWIDSINMKLTRKDWEKR